MSNYLAADFSLDLPDDAIDASIYVFAFPQDRPFTPTLVVRIERHATPVALSDYVDKQLGLLQAGCPELVVLQRRSALWHNRQAFDLLVEWGAREARQRQRSVYVDGAGEPQRIYILTATDTADAFDSNAAMFNRAIVSFVPRSV